MSKPSESTPGAAQQINAAPTSQDREAIAAQQDAAWDDTTTDVDTAAEAGAQDTDRPDPNVITDAPNLAGVVPAPKPGAADASAAAADADKAKKDDAKPGEEVVDEAAAAAAGALTAEEKASAYWKKVSDTFPGAREACGTPRFKAWFDQLSTEDKALAADVEKSDDAIKLMGRYYEDLAAGKVKEPEPPAPPKAFNLSEHITARSMGNLKVTLPDGTETTLGDLAKPEQYGEVLAAVGAIAAASEQAVMTQATQLIQNLVDRGVLVTGDRFNQLLERLGEKDLTAKVPDAPAVTSTPEFKAFVAGSKIMQAAWASQDIDSRAEVVSMFRAEQAKGKVAAVASGQRKTAGAKGDLHRGTLRGGSAGADRGGEDGKTVGEQQDQAWETPIEVEGQKV